MDEEKTVQENEETTDPTVPEGETTPTDGEGTGETGGGETPVTPPETPRSLAEIVTRKSITALIAELRERFGNVETTANAAFKSAKIDGNAVLFYTSADRSGNAAFQFDFPEEYVLDQMKTVMESSFAWSAETYPGSSDPSLDGRPVLVLAVKGDGDSVTYSFLNMEKLMNIHRAKVNGKDISTTIQIEGYDIDVRVNLSKTAGNLLEKKDDGLYVGATKVDGAVDGNLAGFLPDGSFKDSGISAAKVLTTDDIHDYTAEEIAAMLT